MPTTPELAHDAAHHAKKSPRAMNLRSNKVGAPSNSAALDTAAMQGPARPAQDNARALTPRRQSFQPQTLLPEVPTLENPVTEEEQELRPETPRDAHKRLFSDAQRKLLYTLSVPDERLHVVGVCSVLLNLAVVMRWPEHYWILYLVQACVLLPWRFVRFRRTNEELLLLDFCYWVTALAAVWTAVSLGRVYGSGGSDEDTYAYSWVDRAVARAGFMYASGVLAWSVAIFSNRCIFHHVDHMTSSFVHLAPALFFHTLRWGSGLGPGVVHEAWPGLFLVCGSDDGASSVLDAAYAAADACALQLWCSDGCGASVAELLGWPMLLYCVWAVPYFCALFVCGASCIERNEKETLFSFLVADRGLGPVLRAVPDQPKLLRPIVYLVGHALMVLALGALSLVTWYSFWAHALLLAGLGLMTLRQAATWQFHYFALRYAEGLLEQYTAAQEEKKAAVSSVSSELEMGGAGSAGEAKYGGVSKI